MRLFFVAKYMANEMETSEDELSTSKSEIWTWYSVGHDRELARCDIIMHSTAIDNTLLIKVTPGCAFM